MIENRQWLPPVLRARFADFASDDSGATAIEYGLIVAMVALGIASAVESTGSAANRTFNKAAWMMDGGRWRPIDGQVDMPSLDGRATLTFYRDFDGNTRQHYADGDANDFSWKSVDYIIGANGRTSHGIVEYDNGATTTEAYTYDAAGRIVSSRIEMKNGAPGDWKTVDRQYTVGPTGTWFAARDEMTMDNGNTRTYEYSNNGSRYTGVDVRDTSGNESWSRISYQYRANAYGEAETASYTVYSRDGTVSTYNL